MKKNNLNQPIPKGTFGHDLSNSISNKKIKKLDYKNSKETPKQSDTFINPYEMDASSTPQNSHSGKSKSSTANLHKKVVASAINVLNHEPKNTYTKTDISNDADDENNTNSNGVSSSTYSSSCAEESLESKELCSLNSPQATAELKEFETITNSLLKQIKTYREDCFTNQLLSQSLNNSLTLAKEEKIAEREKLKNENNIRLNEITSLYDAKYKELEKKSEDNFAYTKGLEDLFHKVQRYQSEVYQDELRNSKDLLYNTEHELKDLRENYSLLEQWALTMFKVIGERSKSWNNTEFKLTTKEISKALKPPLKRSELQSMYRYLMEYLYLNELELEEQQGN